MSIQLIGMRLFFYIKELRVDLLNKTLKMVIFQPKMARNGQNSQKKILIQYYYALRASS